MIKKIKLVLFYLACFFTLAGIVYQVSIQTPPPIGDKNYILYRVLSAGLGILVASAAIGGFILLEILESRLRSLEEFINWDGAEKKRKEQEKEKKKRKKHSFLTKKAP